MAYHWTDSSPWHAQQRRQHLEGQARRDAANAAYRARSLEEANKRIGELTLEVERLTEALKATHPADNKSMRGGE